MIKTIQDLKDNPENHINMNDKHEIFITENGEKIAKLSSVQTDRDKIARSLFGIIPSDIDDDEARKERFR